MLLSREKRIDARAHTHTTDALFNAPSPPPAWCLFAYPREQCIRWWWWWWDKRLNNNNTLRLHFIAELQGAEFFHLCATATAFFDSAKTGSRTHATTPFFFSTSLFLLLLEAVVSYTFAQAIIVIVVIII